MSGILLPEQFVTEFGDIRCRTSGGCIPDFPQRKQPVANVGRQQGGAATRCRKYPVACRGIPCHVKRGERSIRRRLAAADVGTCPDSITHEVRQVSIDNVFGGDTSKINDHRVIITPADIKLQDTFVIIRTRCLGTDLTQRHPSLEGGRAFPGHDTADDGDRQFGLPIRVGQPVRLLHGVR